MSEPTCIVGSLAQLIAAGKKFKTIYADPPWQYGNQATRAATSNHYQTMTVAEICALPVRELADDKAHLWLWTTNGFLFECPKIFDAWGFEFKSSYIWVKPQIGIGNYLRNAHEFLLLANRGGLVGMAKDVKSWQELPWDELDVNSWGKFKRYAHSSKPNEIRHQVIERISLAPRLELFGRQTADGWTVWGNQVATDIFDTDTEDLR